MTMSLTVELETEQFARLEAEAEGRGVTVSELVGQLLRERLPIAAKASEAQARSGLSAASFARDWESADDQVYNRLS